MTKIVIHDYQASTTGLGILDWSKLHSNKFVQMQLNSVYDIKQVTRSSFVGFYLICDKLRCLDFARKRRLLSQLSRSVCLRLTDEQEKCRAQKL